MSDETQPLNQIKDVIDRNVRTATLDDLKRGGKQKFKVMKMAQFYTLVDRAVNNVIQTQALSLAEEERTRLVDESNREFKRLLGERQQELQDLHRKEEELLEARRTAQRLEHDTRSQKERIELCVLGMDCADCARHVKEAVRRLPGVEQVEVNLLAALWSQQSAA